MEAVSENREAGHRLGIASLIFHLIYLLSYITAPLGGILRLMGKPYYYRAIRDL